MLKSGNAIAYVDIVHKDFLPVYLQTHALPFAQRFSERVLRHTTELATGKGFVPGMKQDWTSTIEGRLKPRPTGAPVNRIKLLFKNLIRAVTRRE
jgi:hypothetical protein